MCRNHQAPSNTLGLLLFSTIVFGRARGKSWKAAGERGLGLSLGELVEDNGVGSGKSATRQAEVPPILIPTLGPRARTWAEMETSGQAPGFPPSYARLARYLPGSRG